jgi:hypothetical protein
MTSRMITVAFVVDCAFSPKWIVLSLTLSSADLQLSSQSLGRRATRGKRRFDGSNDGNGSV